MSAVRVEPWMPVDSQSHPNTRKTHCRHGHPYDAVNTYRGPSGKRQCRTCDQVEHRVAYWRQQVRWLVELVPRGQRTHLRVTPLDGDAEAETVWQTAPRNLCGRDSRQPDGHGWTGMCELCLLGFAGLVTYSRLVHQGRLGTPQRKAEDNELPRNAGQGAPPGPTQRRPGARPGTTEPPPRDGNGS